jgi:transposase InsO family protein
MPGHLAHLGRGNPHGRAWRLSNTTDAPFCLSVLEEASRRRPEIFNTDQGSQLAGTAPM